ncbi:hypothetical protein ACFQ3P_40900 [Paraburkholderia sabiae]|uniref:Uncharacterized protein n=1 Tax=Paraburkholderia sabiae TaxID=273251 RepID=A0ABU9QLW6_9BURK|nr:hypothetical protein [Paraburkholderia sabiae]WJZ77281.1 hypothetical protein QEN71_34980 [Paraburkholderia sabiae]
MDATRWLVPGDHALVERRDNRWVMATPEGWREVEPGDWIVTDVSGVAWPMKDRDFRDRYEPAAEQPEQPPPARPGSDSP